MRAHLEPFLYVFDGKPLPGLSAAMVPLAAELKAMLTDEKARIEELREQWETPSSAVDTEEKIERLLAQLEPSSPRRPKSASPKTLTARKKGRPRLDDEAKRVRELYDQRKPWKEITTTLNLEFKQEKTPEAYRKLLQPHRRK